MNLQKRINDDVRKEGQWHYFLAKMQKKKKKQI